jgi:DNA (cytosine-5)-methyltransferase 1
MKYFSLFSGIGGFELGIQYAYEKISSIENEKQGLQGARDSEGLGSERNNLSSGGLTCVGYSEIDKYAVQVYEKHFTYKQCKYCANKESRQSIQGAERGSIRPERDKPDIESRGNDQPEARGDRKLEQSENNCKCEHKNYGDITKISEAELPEFDLLVGGFPCQSFSIAGKRGGFNDTRGTLFFDIARILKAKQPRLLLLENVKGLLSHDEGRTFATIISTLDELGYDLQWQVLNSKNFGVPQNRERVFIIGHLRGTPRPEVFPIGGNGAEATNIQRHVANTLTARYEGAQATGTYIEEGKLDAQIQQINLPTHSNDRVYGAEGIAPTLNTMQGGRRQPKVATYRHSMEGFKGYEEMSPSIKSSEGSGNQILIDGIRRLTPTECERLQSFPDGWTEGISDTQRYKTLGNAVTVKVIEYIMQRICA